jgi:hypothetical protein
MDIIFEKAFSIFRWNSKNNKVCKVIDFSGKLIEIGYAYTISGANWIAKMHIENIEKYIDNSVIGF